MNTFKCCDGCARRVVGCRSDCTEWAEAVERHALIRAKQEEERITNDYIGSNIIKRKW